MTKTFMLACMLAEKKEVVIYPQIVGLFDSEDGGNMLL